MDTTQFDKLTEKQRIFRLKKGLTELLTAAEKQLALLKQYRDSETQKNIGFDYFYRTLDASWELVRYSKFLGRSNFKAYAFSPARMLYENVFRLEYYINQKIDDQNDIAFWEVARVLKRFYDEFEDERLKNNYEQLVREFGNDGFDYPKIEDKEAYRNPFPSMKVLVEKTQIKHASKFYFHYRYLSECEHSKLVSLYIFEDSDGQYRRCLFYSYLLSRWLLQITDAYIQNETDSIVSKSLKNAEGYVFGAVN